MTKIETDYDADGFDVHGYTYEGFNRDGFDVWGFDADGFDASGHDCKGFRRTASNRLGYDLAGGSPSPNHNRPGEYV